jgi:hypothetical protein
MKIALSKILVSFVLNKIQGKEGDAFCLARSRLPQSNLCSTNPLLLVNMPATLSPGIGMCAIKSLEFVYSVSRVSNKKS